jgi:hypothetical protein
MAQEEITLVIFGLQVDNGLVRADVFARKIRLLSLALKQADKFANGGKHFDFLVKDLVIGSASATLRERASSDRRPKNSSARTVGSICSNVYEGRTVSNDARALLNTVSHLADGADKTFSHAEVRYASDNVIRLDRFFESQAVIARQAFSKIPATEPLFSGVCLTSFDGAIEVLDGRGSLLLAKLTLSAGGSEIDCVLRREMLPEAKDGFKAKVRVTGSGIYNGKSYLPTRFNVENIKQIDTSKSLLGWRGKLSRVNEEELAWIDE